jgi:hypothetical protein
MAYSLYHEDADEPRWAGLIEPDATPAQLREAKAAWQVIVNEKRYRISILVPIPERTRGVLAQRT